ncbi:hypothetical protein DL96DRAFT_1720697 [Flagelloscypha sp. PMI_526]|nr:hypothetical protein DL96DRAFT_1720697 [Flagelloscypha sp. PMI_526]
MYLPILLFTLAVRLVTSAPIAGKDVDVISWRYLELNIRAPVVHPLGKSEVTLFHGTSSDADAKELAKMVDLSKGAAGGDLNDGGFYMTDSIYAAAQFACQDVVEKVFVLEFKWQGTDLRVKEFQNGDPDLEQFLAYDKDPDTNTEDNPAMNAIMTGNDMITGPMHKITTDRNLAPDFRQYAATKQKPIDDGKLTFVTTHELFCSVVPIAGGVDENLYTVGQRSNSGFSLAVATMKVGSGTADWGKAMSE